MPGLPDEDGRLPPGGEGSRRRTKSAAPGGSKPAKREPAAKQGRIDCEIHEGVPTVQGKARVHYATGQGGGLMLVIERRAGERIRINATTELVILEVNKEQVTVAVETSDPEIKAELDAPNEKM